MLQIQNRLRCSRVTLAQTSYLSPISPIIYVEKKFPCGEFSAFHVWRLQGNKKILYMWRNFRCLPMTDVEKSEILHIWHVCDVENVTIYTKFMLFSWKNQFCQNLRTLSRNPFCRNLRTFVWRKIYPKNFYVEKKWQIWGLEYTSKWMQIWWKVDQLYLKPNPTAPTMVHITDNNPIWYQ